MSTKAIIVAFVTSLSMLTAACGNVSQGPSATIPRITLLEGAPGNKPDTFSGFLLSDVTTIVKRDSVDIPTIFNDLGRVSVALALKDPGAPGVGNAPSTLNIVTFTRYRVVYRRNDGRNIQGVDVPFAFDSGLTFSANTDGTVQVGFELVRHNAKEDAPLRALAISGQIISTIADVTFYGKDQAGNNVTIMGSIGVNFGDFADPTT